MERGSSGSSSSSFMGGFGENGSNNVSGLSSMGTMMMMNSGASQILEHNNKLFLPLSWTAAATANSDRMAGNGQRVASFMSQANAAQTATATASCRAKIMAHPLFPRLLAAYVNCQKVGAPSEVVARLEQACAATVNDYRTTARGDDPALDQFMEAYCEMLTKYEQELTKPFKEAMVFFSRIESQLKALAVSSNSDVCDFGGQNDQSSKELDVDVNENYIDPQAEDKELKGQLLRKYSGYLGNLKQEFLKKKKNGKLPKEARQQLLDWWSRHYKWPYPSESQKVSLAESTGLDLKQINNWFINQRKRHWKPSEDMQFVVMDATHPHYYLDNVICNPFSMDCSSTLL